MKRNLTTVIYVHGFTEQGNSKGVETIKKGNYKYWEISKKVGGRQRGFFKTCLPSSSFVCLMKFRWNPNLPRVRFTI